MSVPDNRHTKTYVRLVEAGEEGKHPAILELGIDLSNVRASWPEFRTITIQGEADEVRRIMRDIREIAKYFLGEEDDVEGAAP